MTGAAPQPPALVLASTSTYRRELLGRLRLPFEVAPPLVDETFIASETPPERAQRLGLAKAEAVSLRFPGATVIGSDQVAVCRGEVLDKPGNAARCREQLALLSGAPPGHSGVWMQDRGFGTKGLDKRCPHMVINPLLSD